MASHSKDVLAAVEWFVKLSSEDVQEADHQAWRHWMSESAANALAWQEINHTLDKFQAIPAGLGMSVLVRKQEKVDVQRRSALRNFAIFAAVALPAGWMLQKNLQTHYDYATRVGERREMLLPDGTQLALNTNSAVTVNFSLNDRTIKLHHGEILITSAHIKSSKGPLQVETEDGTITPIGTQFNVRKFDDFTRVSLFEGKLKIQPKLNDADFYMNANQAVDMYPLAVVPNEDEQTNTPSWFNGFVEVNNLALSKLVDELSRYQPGYIVCHPDLKDVRVSGAYAIKNIDASLNSLTQTFPIKIQRVTRYLTILLPKV